MSSSPYEARHFSMGVAVPLRNTKFRFGTTFSSTLTADGPIPPGTTYNFQIETAPLAPALIPQLLRWGFDKILVGPSTHPDNPGAREVLTVSSTTSPGTIHVGAVTPHFSYLTGDPLSGVGYRLPSNWHPSTGDHELITVGALVDQSYGSNLPMTGVYDPYRLWVRLRPGRYLYQTIPEKLLPSTQYLFGCFYKARFAGTWQHPAPDLHVFLQEGTSSVISQFIHQASQGQKNEWTFFLSQTKEQAGGEWGRDGFNGVSLAVPQEGLTMGIPSAVGGSGDSNVTAQIDMPFLCHAQRTSAFKQGIYTFDHFPTLGSVQWSWEDQIRSIRLANGELREFDPTGGGGRIRKHTFQCQFENVSADFFDQLTTLSRWQEEGHDLILITGEQYYGSSLPPVLIGRMRTKQVNKTSWALGLRSFTFTFTEV